MTGGPDSDPAQRLATFLDVGDTAARFPGVTIRDAATMMVIDRTGAAAKVLLGRRHHGHKFMPGKYVFPGGRVEPADRCAPAAGLLDTRVETRLMLQTRRPSAGKARGFALAAVREVFEETGLVLGAKAAGTPPPPPGGGPPDAAREWARFAATGVVPDLSRVHFVARAITPPGRPRRFDTRFFAVDAEAVAARIEDVVGPDTELVELVWAPLDAVSGLDMAGITVAVLEELRIRTAAGFGHDVPVPFYRVHRGRRLRTLLP